ncbi:MAG: hypothetical protein PHD21_03375 [Flavobacteriales bacterium]|nr:hypothetical protein [Flavobacteriales bacterium]
MKFFIIKFKLFIFNCIFLFSLNAYSQSIDTVFYYSDGTVSSRGKMINGVPDGFWKTYYPNGTLKSEGDRKNTLLDGKWTFYDKYGKKEKEVMYQNGLKDGDELTYKDGVLEKKIPFKKNIKEGKAFLFLPNGKIIQQDTYMNDRLWGRGYVYDTTGVIISIVNYKDGMVEGISKINRRDYLGQKSGLWVWMYNQSDVVEHQGTYSRGKKHGFFKYYDQNGNLLKTEKYTDDVLDTKALETAAIEVKREYYPSKKLKSYTSFRAGEKDGINVFYNQREGVDSVKVFSMGVLTEKGEKINPDGSKEGLWYTYTPDGAKASQGEYKGGKKKGEWVFYYPDGTVMQKGEYLDGKENGLWMWFFPDGKIQREDNYTFGFLDGKSISYSQNGKVLSSGNYDTSLRSGEWFFIVENTKDIGKYVDGVKDGLWQQIDIPTSKVVFSCYYREGLRDGKCTMYYLNGAKRAEGFYVGDIMDGRWDFYDETGVQIVSVMYSNGNEVSYDNVKAN